MTTKSRLENWAAVAGLGVCLLVGVPVWVGHLNSVRVTSGPFWLWNALHVVTLAAMIGVWWALDNNRRVLQRVFLAVQFVAAATLVLLDRQQSLTPTLMIFTVANAAMFLAHRTTVALTAANVAIIAVAALLREANLTSFLLVPSLYGMLQVMIVLSTWSEQREKHATAQLALAHTRLRSASVLLAESSQARERLRIARELHDLLGHKLTALALELETATHQSTPPATEHVTRARQLAKELLTDVRATVSELRSRPPELRAALDTLVADIPRPRVHVRVHDAVELDEQAITTLIRCAQEVITNAIRHSEAENLWIDIDESPDHQIVLNARDDGCGASLLKLGNGLTGLRERIEQLGGTVAFDTREGFAVRAQIPSARVVAS
ncbi:sensor histidine kinase [Actinopolymorpha alba]|uniref:sensor histidine kinase n=1 Tax=Actinopolymorpha alba TaxID=533267 RepID=UPI000364001D|nr:histidine kinase [Actinopolymorpha alba]